MPVCGGLLEVVDQSGPGQDAGQDGTAGLPLGRNGRGWLLEPAGPALMPRYAVFLHTNVRCSTPNGGSLRPSDPAPGRTLQSGPICYKYHHLGTTLQTQADMEVLTAHTQQVWSSTLGC